jgi:tripartite-type tricarboxylate transporter receptor subunit TctC
VPTVNEIVPGVVAASWLGISAPAKTPHAIVEKLQAEILAIARAEDFQARASDPAIGMAPLPLDSEKFLGFIQNEIRTWTPVIKAGNIKIN